MFTGIIEELGIVTSLIRRSSSARLTLSASRAFYDVKNGESIAVNGICLTAANVRRNLVDFDVSSETLKRSSLSYLKIGDRVNLERALLVAGRLGGHLVTGHVDGIGEVRKKIKAGEDLEISLSLPSELLAYLVPKGSIAVDGASLTIADFREGLVVISVIPHTVKSTTIALKNVSDLVNVEVDILSKYMEKHLKGGQLRGVAEDTLTRMGILPMGWIDN